MSSHIDIH